MQTRHYICHDREIREENVPLEEPRYPSSRPFVRRQFGNVFTPEVQCAARHRNGTGDQVEDGALAGAIGADNTEDLPFVDVEVECAYSG